MADSRRNRRAEAPAARIPPSRFFCASKILSPEDRVGATLAKCELYHAWGVPFCWVIDPEKQTGWQYHSGGEPERLDRSGTLTAGELKVPLEELFAQQVP